MELRLGSVISEKNRVQELCEKYEGYAPVDLQFIGHLQTNKVRQIIDKVTMIQSVDSTRLAQEISRQAEKANREMDILLEVNIGREENKSGILPEALPELLAWRRQPPCPVFMCAV